MKDHWLSLFAMCVACQSGCDKQKEEDCQNAGAEISRCEREVWNRRIPTGPSHESEVESWRGQVRVCGGMDTIIRVETPAVNAALDKFADYYTTSEPVCDLKTGNCELKGPTEKYQAAKAALEAACN